MKTLFFSLAIVTVLSSCELQVSINTPGRDFTQTYLGLAICDEYISIDSSLMTVVLGRELDSEEVEVDLGDGISFEGIERVDGVIEQDNDIEWRTSNRESFRMYDGELVPNSSRGYSFTFEVRENGGHRGECIIDLDSL